ncbi:MAG TPA: hypothetical protein VLI69_01210 [Gammaproteobacteria bacterium]|nr:hypothetical protein [Gammaproteobacteria bacterium]
MIGFKDQAHLACTNKFFHNFFQPKILNGTLQPSPQQQFLVKKLLNHLLMSPINSHFLLDQLEKNSALFLLKGSVDIPIYNRNKVMTATFRGSPYQLAIVQHNAFMLQTIQEKLCALPQNVEEIKKQLKTLFPKGYQTTKIEELSKNKKMLLEIVNRIDASKASDMETLAQDCEESLKILKDHMLSNLRESCIFSINLFLDALELCTDETRLKALNHNAAHYKAQYFITQVLSLISLFVPTVYKCMRDFQSALYGNIKLFPSLKTEVAQTENLLTQLILDGESPAPTEALHSQMLSN